MKEINQEMEQIDKQIRSNKKRNSEVLFFIMKDAKRNGNLGQIKVKKLNVFQRMFAKIFNVLKKIKYRILVGWRYTGLKIKK